MPDLARWCVLTRSNGVVKKDGTPRSPCLQIAGRHLARALVTLQVIGHLLAVDQLGQTRTLDRRDMHEDILPTIVGLNEAKPLGGVEPFDGTYGHDEPFWKKAVER